MGLFRFFRGKSVKKTDQEPERDQQMQDIIHEALEDFKNRKTYKNLSPEILASVADERLEQAVMDSIDTRFEVGEPFTLEKISQLTEGQQAVFSTWWLEAEVNNGGFNQFYFNPFGQFAQMAEVGFKTIGAEKLSALTKKANKIYSENKERLEAFDDGTAESFSESYKDNPLNALDAEFYQLNDLEDIYTLRVKYIRDHPDQFGTE